MGCRSRSSFLLDIPRTSLFELTQYTYGGVNNVDPAVRRCVSMPGKRETR